MQPPTSPDHNSNKSQISFRAFFNDIRSPGIQNITPDGYGEVVVGLPNSYHQPYCYPGIRHPSIRCSHLSINR